MRLDISNKVNLGFDVGDVVRYCPIGNSVYIEFKTIGCVEKIERMEGCRDAINSSYWITIRQLLPLEYHSDYPVGSLSTIGYGGVCLGTHRPLFRDFREIQYIRRYEMNKIIIDLYPATKDAVLVDKHFGTKLNDPIFVLLLRGKEKELLEEAKQMEKKLLDEADKKQ